MNYFPVGTLIYHKHYGLGIVKSRDLLIRQYYVHYFDNSRGMVIYYKDDIQKMHDSYLEISK